MRPDLKQHMIVGVTVVVAYIAIHLLPVSVWVKAAVAAWLMGTAYEVIQKIRKEGVPDPMDAIVTGLAGTAAAGLLAAITEFLGYTLP